MGAIAWLAVYSLLVLLFSMLGGHLPWLLGKLTHRKLQFYLSISAGVMLGAAIFHVLPDAMEMCGPSFGWWMALAVVVLFCIERFIAPHSHEIDSGQQPHHHHHEHSHDEHHGQGAEHHGQGAHSLDPKEPRAAAPAVAGWMAVLGLTIHTFMNGVGLGGAVMFDLEHRIGAEGAVGYLARLAIPGLAMFLAIVLHKPFDALAISTVLSRKGVTRATIILVQFGFALMVPTGIIAFAVAQQWLDSDFQKLLTGAALAFSAGTFFLIALSDLLPEVQFHTHDRIPLFLFFVLSVVAMGGIAVLEDYGHEGEEHAKPGKVEDGDRGRGHEPVHDHRSD